MAAVGATREVSRKDDPWYRYRIGYASQSASWMSVEEFLNWDSGDELKYELVDGEPRALAPANRTTAFFKAGWPH